MLEELKKKSAKKALPVSILLIVIAVVLLVIFGKKMLASFTGYENFESLTPDEISNQMVELDLRYNFGGFLEQYEENTTTKVQKTEYIYYIIETGDDYAVDWRYMAVRVPAWLESKMEAMADNTYEGYESDPIHLAGEIRKLSSEELRYFNDTFKEAEWTDAEIAEGTLPYVILADHTDTASSKGPYIAVSIGCALLILWAVLRQVKASTGGYLKKFIKDYESAGYTESSVDSDYQRAIVPNAKDPLRIGRLCTYYMGDTSPRAIPNKDISWIYQKTTTHRTNGIKTGTSYSMVINYEGGKNPLEIPFSNEAGCQAMMQKLADLMPWVFVGYGDELARTFRKSHDEFLNIRFNKVEHIVDEMRFSEMYSTFRA